MWVKICGRTSAEAVSAALASAVDAIGFVFAESPRRLTPRAAARLAQPARGRLCCVAVMRHPTQAEVDEVVATFAPDLLQSDAADFDALRLPTELARLPVVRVRRRADVHHVGPGVAEQVVEPAVGRPHPMFQGEGRQPVRVAVRCGRSSAGVTTSTGPRACRSTS